MDDTTPSTTDENYLLDLQRAPFFYGQQNPAAQQIRSVWMMRIIGDEQRAQKCDQSYLWTPNPKPW
jgi:hypothetical protein